MNPKSRAWIWPLLLAATIFTLSGAGQIATPDFDLKLSKDKLAHFLVFGLLATSILRVDPLSRLGWRGALTAATLAIVYGGFDELRQSFTPGRSVEFADWIADTAGAIVAVVVYKSWSRYRSFLEWRVFKAGEKQPRGLCSSPVSHL